MPITARGPCCAFSSFLRPDAWAERRGRKGGEIVAKVRGKRGGGAHRPLVLDEGRERPLGKRRVRLVAEEGALVLLELVRGHCAGGSAGGRGVGVGRNGGQEGGETGARLDFCGGAVWIGGAEGAQRDCGKMRSARRAAAQREAGLVCESESREESAPERRLTNSRRSKTKVWQWARRQRLVFMRKAMTTEADLGGGDSGMGTRSGSGDDEKTDRGGGRARAGRGGAGRERASARLEAPVAQWTRTFWPEAIDWPARKGAEGAFGIGTARGNAGRGRRRVGTLVAEAER